MSGKGSKQRPGEGYQDNFDRIFGERPKRQPYVPPDIPSMSEEEAVRRLMEQFDKSIAMAKTYENPYETPYMTMLRKQREKK